MGDVILTFIHLFYFFSGMSDGAVDVDTGTSYAESVMSSAPATMMTSPISRPPSRNSSLMTSPISRPPSRNSELMMSPISRPHSRNSSSSNESQSPFPTPSNVTGKAKAMKQSKLSNLLNITCTTDSGTTMTLEEKETRSLVSTMEKQARILPETGRQFIYNTLVNDECVATAKKIHLLFEKGSKEKLIQLAREKVNKSYEFQKGFSQSKKGRGSQSCSSGDQANWVEAPRKKWSSEIRQENMANCQSEIKGIEQDLQICSKQLEVKMKCEKHEEAEALRKRIVELRQKKRSLEVEMKMIDAKQQKAIHDARYNKKWKELAEDNPPAKK
jgi:hypothetical protein